MDCPRRVRSAIVRVSAGGLRLTLQGKQADIDVSATASLCDFSRRWFTMHAASVAGFVSQSRGAPVHVVVVAQAKVGDSSRRRWITTRYCRLDLRREGAGTRLHGYPFDLMSIH